MTQTDLAGLRKCLLEEIEFRETHGHHHTCLVLSVADCKAILDAIAYDRGELVEAHQSQSESNQRQNREPGHLDSRTDGVASRRDTPRSVIHPVADEMHPANVSAGVTAGETAPYRSEPAGGAASINAELVELVELVEALKECADDLEAEIEARYDKSKDHPAMAPKYQRDMGPVHHARHLLAALSAPAAEQQSKGDGR